MEGMIGEIRLFAGTFAPKNWSYCNGAIINISSNTALFSILGVTYGGNGTTNFALPNLNGRVAVGAGSGPGLSTYALGQSGGVASVTLTVDQMAVHTHAAQGTYAPLANAAGSDETNPGGERLGKSTVGDIYVTDSDGFMGRSNGSVVLAPDGGNLPHSNQQPYLGMNYVICMYGIYPARN